MENIFLEKAMRMHLWKLQRWNKIYANKDVRRGLRVRYDANVDVDVKESIHRFITWIRWQYDFPMRVVIYVKSEKAIIARDGTYVNGTFLGPVDHYVEPYIKIATGEYCNDSLKRGRDNALASILATIAHELSHYFQWLNDLNQTLRGEEYQATLYANKFIKEYACFVDHP